MNCTQVPRVFLIGCLVYAGHYLLDELLKVLLKATDFYIIGSLKIKD